MRIIEIEIPDDVTVGDLITARGAIFDASTIFVDWEKLYEGGIDAVNPVGRLLLGLAAGIKKAESP